MAKKILRYAQNDKKKVKIYTNSSKNNKKYGEITVFSAILELKMMLFEPKLGQKTI
jgi:hypothetical protein